MHRRRPAKCDPVLAREPCGEHRDRIAGLNAQFMRAKEHGLEPRRLQIWAPLLCRRRREQPAAFGHVGAQKCIEHGCGFGAPRGEPQALLYHWDAGLGHHLLPHVARAARAVPHRVAILTGDRDEPEVAHRGAAGAHVALDDDYLELAPRSSQGAGQTDDAGADHCEIKLSRGSDHRVMIGYGIEGASLPRLAGGCHLCTTGRREPPGVRPRAASVI
jgi:hypothetical protein